MRSLSRSLASPPTAGVWASRLPPEAQVPCPGSPGSTEDNCSMTHAPTEHPAVPEGDKLKKKPIYTRVWFWLLVIIVVIIVAIILIAAVSGGGNDPSGGSVSGDPAGDADAADTPAGPTFPGQQARDTLAAAWQTITLDNVAIRTTPLYDGRAVGSTAVVCSTVTIVNHGDAAVSVNGGVDWKLQDPAGVARGTTPGGTDTLLGSGELPPGGAVTRDVCFDNTTGAPGQYALFYEPAFSLSGDRAVWLSTR